MQNINLHVKSVKHIVYIIKYFLTTLVVSVIFLIMVFILATKGWIWLFSHRGALIFLLLSVFPGMLPLIALGNKISYLFHSEPLLILTDQSLICNYWCPLVIPWSEVDFVKAQRPIGRGENILQTINIEIALKNPRIFAAKIAISQRFIMILRIVLGYSTHIIINLNSVDISAEDLVNIIQTHLYSNPIA